MMNIAAWPYSSFITLYQLCRRVEQVAGGGGGVVVAEDGRAGDEDFGAGGGHRADVVGADAAVHFDAHVEVALADGAAQAPDLLDRARDELLPAEARVDRHDQHVVDEIQDLVERAQTRRGVDDD